MERPDMPYQSTENDDTESTDSSLCIIVAEDLEVEENTSIPDGAIESKGTSDDANTSAENKKIQNENEQIQIIQDENTEDSFSAMTQSQYAQVVFHDVADSYPNDTDIFISFTLTTNVPTNEKRNTSDSISGVSFSKKIAGDRIGVFRVPFVSPSDILKFEWVTETDCTNEGGVEDVGTVIFKAGDLPKDEDFYQFQYLRVSEDASQNVLGASIPFQLRKPKNEELCAVQNSSEFMVVQTTTALASGQFSEKMGSLEAEKSRLRESLNRTTHDYGRLLELSENLTEQLEQKSISFIQLEKNCHHRKLDLDQTKADLGCLIQDKHILEERLQKSVELAKTLQTKQDNMQGDYQKKNREISLLKEERDRLIARADDTRQLLGVMTESKEVATKLVKSHIVRADNLQKELESVKHELANKKRLEEKIKHLTISLEDTKKQLTEDKDSQTKHTLMVDRGVACDGISNGSSNYVVTHEVGTNVDPAEELKNIKPIGKAEMTDSAYERELELDEAFQTLNSGDTTDDLNDSSRLKEMESRLSKLHEYLRTTEKSHYRKIKEMKEDIVSLRSSAASSDVESLRNISSGHVKFQGRTHDLDGSMDSENSLRLLDYDLIGREISKSNNGSSKALREKYLESIHGRKQTPNLNNTTQKEISSGSQTSSKGSEECQYRKKQHTSTSTPPLDTFGDAELNQRFVELKTDYLEKKNRYLMILEVIYEKELGNNGSEWDMNYAEIVQNHLKLLADCFPDVPPPPTSIYTRFDRHPNAVMRTSHERVESSCRYNAITILKDSPLQSYGCLEDVSTQYDTNIMQEEPLNLTTEDSEHNPEAVKDLTPSIVKNEDSNNLVQEIQKIQKEMQKDAIGRGYIEDIGGETRTVLARKRPPFSIDIPSIGAVAALSTAAVVSPVVAMAAVGYGVVKILSGNQANNEPRDDGHPVNIYPDFKTPCLEEESFIKTQNTNTIVNEPSATASIPENEMRNNKTCEKATGAVSKNPFHNPQNPFLADRSNVTIKPKSPLPEPLVPQPTASSAKAEKMAKHSSVKGLQELCKGLFWSTEDLSIPATNRPVDSESDLSVDAPWCTSDLATVHSRLRELDETSDQQDKVGRQTANDLQQFGAYYDDNSIRVYPGDGNRVDTELNSTEESSEEITSFKLTDDGRAIQEMFCTKVPHDLEDAVETSRASNKETQEETDNLTCPICSAQFERTPENARNLVLHVDEHLVEELKCPVCSIVFNITNQNAYENHVNSHFNDANDYVEVDGQNNQSSAPALDDSDDEERERPRFWFVDNID